MPSFVSAIYAPVKDIFLYLKGEREDIKDLEGRLRTLLRELISVISRKRNIDDTLKTSSTKEKSDEYIAIEAEFEGILKNYTKFTSKYAKITGELPAPTDELDVLIATDMIKKLDEIKPNFLTVNFLKLADLSKDIAKLSKQVSECLGRVVQDNMIRDVSEPYEERLNDESGSDHPVFNKYVDKVLSYLSAESYGNRVGVLGPIGVGKTAVMKRLHNRLMATKVLSRLDNIIWIQQQMTVEKMQNEIMLQLRIDREKTNSEHVNASLISNFLDGKKYILLIDHVSENIDLNSLGLRDYHKCRNVVIASRERKAIRLMITDEVEIQRLEKEEALELFEMIHGTISDRRLEGIADRIVDFCGGLAKVIKLVATYLKNKKDEGSWNDVKRNIQGPTESVNLKYLGGIDFIYKQIYDELEPSYKSCLLFTALFPNEHIIFKDYLVECWMAECFINVDCVQKLRRTRESGQTILDHLTDVYLLDWCLEGKYVKMPSFFRRVALELKYPGDETCLVWVPSDDKRLEEGTWRMVKRMSLICCKTELPESPECSNIHTLLLRSIPSLNNLADAFFLHMPHIHVLDLYQTDIAQLPTSVNRLVNLKSLCLKRCKNLEMLPNEASQLTKLEFLDICGTSIRSLPLQITSMVELRCLRAAFSHEIIIPLGIIENLANLEELSISAVLYSPSETAQLLAMELAGLEYLTTLHFNFPNVSAFNTFVTQSKSFNNRNTGWGSDTFRYFRILVGGEIQHSYESDVSKLLAERRLRFSGDEEFSLAVKSLLDQTCAFELIGDQRVETLSRYNLHSVKVCIVGSCSHLKNIVGEIDGIVEKSSSGVFKDLEKLHLYDLQLLECVWEPTRDPQHLGRLTVLTLKDCPTLTRILDPQLCCALPSLKHLKVENCRLISQIVEVPNKPNNSELVPDMLNSVLSIELINLPFLLSVCSSDALSLSWNSLDSLVITECSNLSNLSLTETNAQRLKSITCERSWWDQLQLAGGVKRRLSKFCPFEEESSERVARSDQETSNGIIDAGEDSPGLSRNSHVKIKHNGKINSMSSLLKAIRCRE